MSTRWEKLKKRCAEDPECLEKIRAAQGRYREAHKEEIAECRRRKWKADPELRAYDREWRRRRRLKRYGLSVADYAKMCKRQHGACAICKKSHGVLCVDHCHACGKVRGLLCAKCNSALGFCNDSPERLLAAAAYLQAACGKEETTPMTAPSSSGTDSPESAMGAGVIADARHCRCAGKAV